jgi:uncharacterized protein (TIGR02145 family)
MFKKLTLFILPAVAHLLVFSQQTLVELTFTAVYEIEYVQLDSIRVMNRTRGEESMLYWPDTTISLEIGHGDELLFVGYATFSAVGLPEEIDQTSSFELYQNYPNPMGERSEISLYLPQSGTVQIMITDMQGRSVLRTVHQLAEGRHDFRFYPGGGNIWFLTAYWNGMSRSIKMIASGAPEGNDSRLVYAGSQPERAVFKNAMQVNDFIVRESGIPDAPEGNTTYTFRFATNIPCPGEPTVEYGGQVYNTIQIFSQCWLRENLNVGTRINSHNQQMNNGLIEKYCYHDEISNCGIWGGLYQWNEMMQYETGAGKQGICPPGWHLPSDEEWKVLEGAVDSHYGIGHPVWDSWDLRGIDAGSNLKSTSGWNGGNGLDLYGFTALPAGYNASSGAYLSLGEQARFWSSTHDNSHIPWRRFHRFISPGVDRTASNIRTYGFSVRCIKDL